MDLSCLLFQNKKSEINSKIFADLKIWDIPDCDRKKNRKISTNFLKVFDGVIFVYDISNPKSFDKIEKSLLPFVISEAKIGVRFCLIANKIDCQRQVSKEVFNSLKR